MLRFTSIAKVIVRNVHVCQHCLNPLQITNLAQYTARLITWRHKYRYHSVLLASFWRFAATAFLPKEVFLINYFHYRVIGLLFAFEELAGITNSKELFFPSFLVALTYFLLLLSQVLVFLFCM